METTGIRAADTSNASPKKLSVTPLHGLDVICYQHPSDLALINRLESLPLVGSAVGGMVDLKKRQIEIGLIANAVHVTPAVLPRLFSLHQTAFRCLGVIGEPPPLYIQQDPVINAYTTGCDAPYVCVTSGAVGALTDRELLYLLGHELGHVCAQHVRYQLLARLLLHVGRNGLPLAGLVQLAVDVTALPLLLLWSRRAELTADRAGLLVCQDRMAAFSVMMKLAGYPAHSPEPPPTDRFLEQSEEFEALVHEDVVDSVFDLTSHVYASHPRIVDRVAQLQRWVDDGSYDELVNCTADERRELAARIERDPVEAEFAARVRWSLVEWACAELSLDRPTVARPLRAMLSRGVSLRGTAVESVLRVELVIENLGANACSAALVILHRRHGKPIRTTCELAWCKSWHDLPSAVRHDMMRAGTRQQSRLLYSVGA